MQKILFIISGGISCYKAVEAIRLLQKNNYIIDVILTKSAQKFITPLLITSLINGKFYDDLFLGLEHINLSRSADLIVIAPATANLLAKMACGIANDLASALLLANNKPVLIFPAMNTLMWQNQATQNNLKFLQQNELLHIIEPKAGLLACREYGAGKMQEAEEIAKIVADFFYKPLAGIKVILTGGSTQESIDPVRFIGNRSSGKQSLAIAYELQKQGAELLFIAGNIVDQINLPATKIIKVQNTQQMLDQVLQNIDGADVFIGCAAVADFGIKYTANKIKKQQQNLTLTLIPNPDILQTVAKSINRPKLVIGFAAESDNLIANAQHKLINKNCDLIVANDIDNGNIFASDNTKIILVEHQQVNDLGIISKCELAKILVTKIIAKFHKNH
jgi:phosphopantothenoylcysteine decarboxylase/phosphopantothenate--cysteine ligase